MYDKYKINEEDIQSVIRYLELHDPQNANRDYAIQLIESFKEFGSEVARSDESLAEMIRQATEKKD